MVRYLEGQADTPSPVTAILDGASAGCWALVVAAFEAPAVVAGLDDVAVVGEAIEQRSRHLGITEDARPFAEGEVCRDDNRGTLVEPADEVEQELPAGLGEGDLEACPASRIHGVPP